VPKMVDEYFSHLEKYQEADEIARIDNPVWHIHAGNPPQETLPVGFSLLLNLAGVCQAETPDVIWGYLEQYAPGLTPENSPQLARLVSYAVTYYQERVRPGKSYRAPDDAEITALQQLDARLAALAADAVAEDIQSAVFAVGKDAGYEPLRDWFSCLYQVLLGQNEGPRMGSFIKLYGIAETRALIGHAVAGDLARGDM